MYCTVVAAACCSCAGNVNIVHHCLILCSHRRAIIYSKADSNELFMNQGPVKMYVTVLSYMIIDHRSLSQKVKILCNGYSYCSDVFLP